MTLIMVTAIISIICYALHFTMAASILGWITLLLTFLLMYKQKLIGFILMLATAIIHHFFIHVKGFLKGFGIAFPFSLMIINIGLLLIPLITVIVSPIFDYFSNKDDTNKPINSTTFPSNDATIEVPRAEINSSLENKLSPMTRWKYFGFLVLYNIIDAILASVILEMLDHRHPSYSIIIPLFLLLIVIYGMFIYIVFLRVKDTGKKLLWIKIMIFIPRINFIPSLALLFYGSAKDKCPKCNAILNKGINFCPECGAKISKLDHKDLIRNDFL